MDEAGENGRPPKVDAPGKVRIAQIVRHQPAVTSERIAAKAKSTTGNQITSRTVRRVLSNMRYSRKKQNKDDVLGHLRPKYEAWTPVH